MNVRLGVEFASGLDELVHELVILLSPNSPLAKTQIQRVIKQLLIVGATVQNDGKSSVGVDACAERGEDQLGNADENAATALISNAQDAFTVCRMSQSAFSVSVPNVAYL